MSDIPPNLAEDVVRGKIRLAGGGALLPGLASKDRGGDRKSPLSWSTTRCGAWVRGAADILERDNGP